MDRRKELKEQYKEIKTEAGVYQIKNKINQKILIISTPNLKSINGRRLGGYPGNMKFQKEWNEFGADAFEFEVLEVLEKKDEPFFDVNDALKKLEQKWIDKLQPFGEKGYH